MLAERLQPCTCDMCCNALYGNLLLQLLGMLAIGLDFVRMEGTVEASNVIFMSYLRRVENTWKAYAELRKSRTSMQS